MKKHNYFIILAIILLSHNTVIKTKTPAAILATCYKESPSGNQSFPYLKFERIDKSLQIPKYIYIISDGIYNAFIAEGAF